MFFTAGKSLSENKITSWWKKFPALQIFDRYILYTQSITVAVQTGMNYQPSGCWHLSSICIITFKAQYLKHLSLSGFLKCSIPPLLHHIIPVGSLFFFFFFINYISWEILLVWVLCYPAYVKIPTQVVPWRWERPAGDKGSVSVVASLGSVTRHVIHVMNVTQFNESCYKQNKWKCSLQSAYSHE